MKKLVEEVSGEGLESLIGEHVILFCVNYFYAGKLIGVNSTDVLLTEAGVVFETGPYTKDGFEDFQQTPNDIYVRTTAIEAYTVMK